jgi:hypothetical protein
MRFVLDTDVLSTFRKRKPHPGIAAWAGRVEAEDLTTTVVTVTEIQRGIERMRPHHPQEAADAEAWLDGMIAAADTLVLPLDSMAARLLGRMYETPALRHFIITDPAAKAQATGADLAIAAIAIAAEAVLATVNTRHFLQIHQAFSLPGLFNPASGEWAVEPLGG